MQTSPETLLLTSGDAARLAGVAVETVRLWERTGRLEATRTVGGIRLYTRAAVLRVAAERADRLERRSARR